ncbi:MAG: hypothetical protein PHC94_03565 [Methylobacter sp.]|nr:hypothetical protein [Methylobacter sp.]
MAKLIEAILAVAVFKLTIFWTRGIDALRQSGVILCRYDYFNDNTGLNVEKSELPLSVISGRDCRNAVGTARSKSPSMALDACGDQA